jgi:transcriptional regulator with XRE-family HTH domain
MSQDKLGEALGITFQQVQKYEKGVNRISVSRLNRIASILGVEMSYFLPESESKKAVASPAYQDSIELLAAFEKIPSKTMKRAIIGIAQAASENTPI